MSTCVTPASAVACQGCARRWPDGNYVALSYWDARRREWAAYCVSCASDRLSESAPERARGTDPLTKPKRPAVRAGSH